MLSSQGLVLATAMAVSAGTIIILDLLRDKYFPQNQQSFPEKHRILRSCLTSSASEDVKDTIGNGEEYRRQFETVNNQRRRYSCGNAGNKGMPENRAALDQSHVASPHTPVRHRRRPSQSRVQTTAVVASPHTPVRHRRRLLQSRVQTTAVVARRSPESRLPPSSPVLTRQCAIVVACCSPESRLPPSSPVAVQSPDYRRRRQSSHASAPSSSPVAVQSPDYRRRRPSQSRVQTTAVVASHCCRRTTACSLLVANVSTVANVAAAC
nr:uncharacterized protein LOC109164651 [Ipomoea batatas]